MSARTATVAPGSARLVRAAILALAAVLGTGATAAAPAAGTPEALFAAGNAAYEEQRYEAAAEAYQKVLGFGITDPRVLYNLGNALFRMGRVGQAILHYERALRLDPSDRETRDNLDLARGLIRDRVGEPELQYPIRVVKETLETIPTPSIGWVFLVFWSAAAAAGGAIPLTASWIRRRLLAAAVLALGLCALTAGAALLYRGRQDAAPIAIVLEEKVDVRSGPGEENTVLFTVHEGTRLDLRNRLDLWVQVSLPNGLSGWVPVAALEQV